MPDPALYAAFIAATAVLMLIPGPNVAMIVGNSIAWGTRSGLLTVAGTSSAMVPQLALAAIGMTAALATIGVWFEWLRWLGAAYLVYLGLRQWFAAPVDLTKIVPARRPLHQIWARGFLVSLTNPKTLLFYGAFFPQFVSRDAPLAPQILLLSLTFLLVAVAIDSTWALAAARARGLLATRGRLRNRVSGGFLMGAGVALALTRRS
ncbi:MAG TPA: LysE family translocator [Acetobacteraceae bacterium]|jgi:threonine/homoserine/homoserine lactone efflux protein|nr:LysE family translocator [Acetobacteraceae bacterium]